MPETRFRYWDDPDLVVEVARIFAVEACGHHRKVRRRREAVLAALEAAGVAQRVAETIDDLVEEAQLEVVQLVARVAVETARRFDPEALYRAIVGSWYEMDEPGGRPFG